MSINMQETSFTYIWSIPSISKLIDSKIDEILVTVNSVFKVQLNFRNMADDQINLFVLPLIPVSGFKFSISKCLYDPRGSADEKSSYTQKLTLPEAMFECVPPISWILCQKMSVKQIKNEVTALAYNFDTTRQSNNAIHLNFELKFCYDTKIKVLPDESFVALCNDYEHLFTSGKFHDAVIKTNEGKEINVHKSILAIRCEVLNAAFEHNTIESETNVIDSPFDDETMENLLLHVYCHKTPNIETIAEKLLVAADYYQLNDLKSKCAEILIKKLSGENAVEFLELALTHSCRELEVGVMNFINDKSIANIVQSEDWLESVNVDVFKKICEHCVILFNKI